MTTQHGGIGNVVDSSGLVEMAMSYTRSRVVCAAARLEVADLMAGGERTVQDMAQALGADVDALYRLLRALSSLGLAAETVPGSFVLTSAGQPLRKDVAHSAWAAVVFWSDLVADDWSFLTEYVRSGQTASKVMECQGIVPRWTRDPEAGAIFRAVMGTGTAEDYLPIVASWDFTDRRVVADLPD